MTINLVSELLQCETACFYEYPLIIFAISLNSSVDSTIHIRYQHLTVYPSELIPSFFVMSSAMHVKLFLSLSISVRKESVHKIEYLLKIPYMLNFILGRKFTFK